jgi:hypothetical protein
VDNSQIGEAMCNTGQGVRAARLGNCHAWRFFLLGIITGWSFAIASVNSLTVS